MKIAVVGGVAAGTSAAAKASRTNEDAEIVLFEKGEDISYAGCGLPYYISEVTKSRGKVVLNTPQEFSEKYGVEVKIRHEVTNIDKDNKVITYKDLENDTKGTYEYDKLIITTGAKPIVPPIEGIDLDNIQPLRSVKDADQIKEKMTGVEKVTIVGAGLIGLEMAESFAELDKEVTVVELQDKILPPFSEDITKYVDNHLREQGVNLVLGDGVNSFKGEDSVEQVITSSGQKIEADFVLLSLGIKPEVSLAKQAGIAIGKTGAIEINERMETNVKDIYAAGDCAETINLLTDERVWVPMGSTANKQGRIAGENAADGENHHLGVFQTAITKIFDYTVAKTGIDENEAAESGYDPVVVTITGANHAHYFPNFKKMKIRGVFDKNTHRILGAQIEGESKVDKRIDVISTAIYSELRAEDLFQIDLAYAPPYSTPKDPVAVLGMVAEKKLNK
ncbi:MAG TPA: FAD-dependent oxidoreductase [Halanaerobiales bacterium]|nr:FAD-dependent oxidoreductase [Halanaerobiales bacterium]